MPELQLTPAGQLRWHTADAADADAVVAEIVRAFHADLREGWFLLTARRPQLTAWPGSLE